MYLKAFWVIGSKQFPFFQRIMLVNCSEHCMLAKIRKLILMSKLVFPQLQNNKISEIPILSIGSSCLKETVVTASNRPGNSKRIFKSNLVYLAYLSGSGF